MPVIAAIAVVAAAIARAGEIHAAEVELLTAAVAIRGCGRSDEPRDRPPGAERGPAMISRRHSSASLTRGGRKRA